MSFTVEITSCQNCPYLDWDKDSCSGVGPYKALEFLDQELKIRNDRGYGGTPVGIHPDCIKNTKQVVDEIPIPDAPITKNLVGDTKTV